MNPVKAHQRLIRERMARLPEPDIDKKRELASSLDNAEVREIDHKAALEIILQYEWIGNAGTSEYRFGLYFGPYLAGVVSFGRTAGSNAAASVCGKENAHLVTTLSRGACVHWAPSNSASFLINRACRLMAEKGFNVFVAYSDTEAGEVGTVYQASNWLYLGRTNGSEQFRWPGAPVEDDNGRDWKDGAWHDCRRISAYTRNRQNRKLLRELRSQGKAEFQGKKIKGSDRNIYLESEPRAELRARMIDGGFEFRKGTSKFKYVHFAGDKRTVRRVKKALRWKLGAYPKREGGLVEGNTVSTTDGDGVRSPGTAPVSYSADPEGGSENTPKVSGGSNKNGSGLITATLPSKEAKSRGLALQPSPRTRLKTMSKPEEHPIADAGVEHDAPDYFLARRDDPSTPNPAAAAVNTTKLENERDIPTDVMPDWEEL
jgi:hypothetical protein